MSIMKWKCLSCGKINESDSSKTYNIDMCECGKSGVDLEESYYRTLGDVEEIISGINCEGDLNGSG